jgi:hypothetical protein
MVQTTGVRLPLNMYNLLACSDRAAPTGPLNRKSLDC